MSDPRLTGLSLQERALLFEKLREKKKSAPEASRPDLPLGPRPRPEETPPPLSFAQQRLWFLDRLRPGDPMYNIPQALRIVGALSAAGLRRALGTVVARHESLRTTFRVAGNEPVQVIAPAERAACGMPEIDLSGLGARAWAEAARLYGEESLRAFDLAAGPLLRATLLRLAAQEHLLILILHHAVSDGWSNGILVRELTTAYEGGALPELPIQYADFAVWQRRWLQGGVLEGQIAFWRQRLSGMPPALDLPSDRPRPAVRSGRGSMRELSLGPEATARLKELARRGGTTLFTVLLAVFQTLLCRLTGQEDLGVGTPVAGRNRSELARLIGFFVNTVVLRGDLSGDPEFGELVGRLRRVALEAFDHQDLPFEKLVEELRPERDPSRPPLVQVQLVLHNTPAVAPKSGGLRLDPVEAEVRTAKLDLSLSLVEHEGGLASSLTYSTDLFDAATIGRLASHFVLLTEAACADPRRRLADLPLLTAAERAQLLREWNDPSPAPAPANTEMVPALFARCAVRFPDRTAVVCGERSFSYRELARRAGGLAQELRRRGVGPEMRVALAMERSLALVEGLLAVLTAGGAYVPLDPALPAGRWAELLALSGAALVLADNPSLERLQGTTVPVITLEEGGAESLPDLSAIPEILPETVAYVIFTSGSTGEPKGVVVEHRQLRGYVDAVIERLPELAGAACAMVSTFAADLGHTVLFPSLCSGGCLHVVPPATALDPEAFSHFASRHPIDVLKIVPSHLEGLLQASRPERVLPRRLLVLGGEEASWELADRAAALAPSCRIANHYGPTEATVGAVAQPIVVSSRPRPRRPPLGRPLRNAEAYVLDPGRQPAPAGVPGELWLGGGGLARGYLGRPGLTAERFAPHPFAARPGERLYRTGDRARWLPDGSLEFLGRVDRQVKIRGFRIEPGEVEAVLARHPTVAACAVLVRGEAEGEALSLTAYVVLRHGDLRELREHLAGLLPAAMVPAGWIALEALPLTANGKLDRQALARIGPERRPESDTAAPPRTAVERELAALWSELLGVERVGIGDSFFDLGGHSLLLPRMQSALRERMGRDVPLIKLFEHPTVEALAAWLEGAAEEGLDSAESRDRVRRQRHGLELQRQRLAQRRMT
jgi:amino acid adenylation domain-containing protein